MNRKFAKSVLTTALYEGYTTTLKDDETCWELCRKGLLKYDGTTGSFQIFIITADGIDELGKLRALDF